MTIDEPAARVADDRVGTPMERVQLALAHRYVFRRELGRGGSAHVFLVYDQQVQREVAMKVLRPELSAAVGTARFLREIEIGGRLEHSNILPMYESGYAEESLYYTMPFVEGETLRTRLRREEQLSLGDAIAIARDVAVALDYAHSQGLIHRDIKPANILLTTDGRAIVADFGIARAITVASGDEITDSGLAIGTPEYMSPEQGSGKRKLDSRTDIYALACVLYEMIAGEPPFTGPSAQAIIARHCQEPPRSIRVIRPSVPIGVERAIEKALAKVPADRFATASQLVAALEAADPLERPARRITLPLLLGVAAACVVVGLVSWSMLRLSTQAPPDPNRIVVFPLRDQAPAGSAGGDGEAIATYIGYALAGTQPLKWLEGLQLLEGNAHREAANIDPAAARAIARRTRAAYFIDGSILRRTDSTTVVLRLHDATGDSIVKVVGASGPSASTYLPQLGLSAIAALLPPLLEPGRSVDLRPLSERNTTAIANFLQGEREYGRMQFSTALEHYRAAIAADSAFALAALKGAQAANWRSQFEQDTSLVRIALRRLDLLPVAYRDVARGLNSYLTGDADSAILYLRRAIRTDSTVRGAWPLLGEVYSRLLPTETPADSLATDALERSRRVEPEFAPALLLLEEMAFRRGEEQRAFALREELRRAGADTTHSLERDLMLRCVRDGPGAIDWRQATRRDELSVLSAGKILSEGAAQPACALAAFRAVLDGVKQNRRRGALAGVNGLLVALDRGDELRALLASHAAAGLEVPTLYMLDAASHAGFEREARAAADSIGTRYETVDPTTLWLLGSLAARVGDVARLRGINSALIAKADSSRSRRDVLISHAIAARLSVLEGDSAGAIRALTALKASAPRGQIAWGQPWESLGLERMQLAELLMARRQYDAARHVASQLDATEPVMYLVQLRRSLELRVTAARQLGDRQSVATYQRRLVALRRLTPH